MLRAGCSTLDLHKRQVHGTVEDKTPEFYQAFLILSTYALDFVCRMLRSLCVSHLRVTMSEVPRFTILESFRSTFGVLTANLKPLTTV